MIRREFTMRLKPEALAQYKYHHDNIWPELVEEIERAASRRSLRFNAVWTCFWSPRSATQPHGTACGARRFIASGPS